MQNFLKNAYDLHIHCWPDVVERKVDDAEMARRAIACGMKGFAIKSHYTPTAERAAMIRRDYPEIHVIGGIVLNTTVGGINPMAVECAARNQAKIVWFPTMDSSCDQEYMMRTLPQFMDMQVTLREKGICVNPVTILDSAGKLRQEVYDVLEVAKANHMVIASGHMSHAETFALVKAAQEQKVEKVLITHADWESTYYSIADQRKLVGMGAVIEHSFTSPWKGHVSWEEVFQQIRGIGVSNCILTTDLGQIQNIYPDEGLQQFAETLYQNGFTDDELHLMLCDLPAALVE